MAEAPHSSLDSQNSTPSSWADALMSLIFARCSIFRIEAQEAAATASLKFIQTLIAALLLVIAWLFTMIGGAFAIASFAAIPWYWVLLSFAAIHLIVALWFLNLAKKTSPKAFAITLDELQKDREWIANFKNNSKSKH